MIDSHLMNIMNNDLSNNSFSNEAKVSTVRPIYKKKSRDKIENFRPISILSCVFQGLREIASREI